MKKQSFTTKLLPLVFMATAMTSYAVRNNNNMPTPPEQPNQNSLEHKEQLKRFKSQVENPVVFTVKGVRQFDQLRGNANWKPNAQRRFESAVFKFYSDNTFLFMPTYDTRTDIYPLKGNYTVNGNTILFSASRQSATSNGSASVEIQGRIFLEGSVPAVSMYWISSSGLAAVINNTPYASSSVSAYQIEAVLQYNR